MFAAVPALFLAIVLPLFREHDLGRRAHASLLMGTSLAWALLPHSILDFRDHGLASIATGVPGCQVMALGGFPIQQISAHGGGGWRLGFSLLSDRLTHAGNCCLLALAIWFVLGLVPRRLWARVHLGAWFAFLPLCFYGIASMVRWWD